MTTGREESTHLVTLSRGTFVAPETNWETGEMGTGGMPPFRGFARLFRSLISPRGLVKSFPFRMSRDTISTGREE